MKSAASIPAGHAKDANGERSAASNSGTKPTRKHFAITTAAKAKGPITQWLNTNISKMTAALDL